VPHPDFAPCPPGYYDHERAPLHIQIAARRMEREMRKHVRKIVEKWVVPAFGGDGRATERRYMPECSCGWRGTGSRERTIACREYQRHVAGPEVAVRSVA
jgi:hypothetical protein